MDKNIQAIISSEILRNIWKTCEKELFKYVLKSRNETISEEQKTILLTDFNSLNEFIDVIYYLVDEHKKSGNIRQIPKNNNRVNICYYMQNTLVSYFDDIFHRINNMKQKRIPERLCEFISYDFIQLQQFGIPAEYFAELSSLTKKMTEEQFVLFLHKLPKSNKYAENGIKLIDEINQIKFQIQQTLRY